MVIDDELLNKLLSLAYLEEKDPEKRKKLIKDLVSISSQFDKLNEIDTEWVEPISQVTWLQNITREDKPSLDNSHEDIIAAAPSSSEDWSILVKNVL